MTSAVLGALILVANGIVGSLIIYLLDKEKTP